MFHVKPSAGVKSFPVALEALLFHFSHSGQILRTFVFVAKEVKHSVNDHPQQFILKTYTQIRGILFYTIYANVDVGLQGLGVLSVGKGYNVGIIIVLQVLSVDFQKVIIRAENKIKGGSRCFGVKQYFFYPFLNRNGVK